MSRLMLYILLFVFYSSVADASSLRMSQVCVESEVISACDDNIAKAGLFDEHNGVAWEATMLLPRTAARYIVENVGGSNLLPAYRYSRTGGPIKSLSEATPHHHVGRTTKIVEYNHFRSILRVAYYLHTLCRLRI